MAKRKAHHPKSKRERSKIEQVMHEYKEGRLYSSSGDKVTSRDQAIAIALSEARRRNNMRNRRKKRR